MLDCWLACIGAGLLVSGLGAGMLVSLYWCWIVCLLGYVLDCWPGKIKASLFHS